jgi:hypothetical protein
MHTNFYDNFYHAPRKTTAGEIAKLIIGTVVIGAVVGLILTALFVSIFS